MSKDAFRAAFEELNWQQIKPYASCSRKEWFRRHRGPWSAYAISSIEQQWRGLIMGLSLMDAPQLLKSPLTKETLRAAFEELHWQDDQSPYHHVLQREKWFERFDGGFCSYVICGIEDQWRGFKLALSLMDEPYCSVKIPLVDGIEELTDTK